MDHDLCQNSKIFRLRFNRNLLQNFTPTCGLRQGDPISPYLFLFVADGLSRLIQSKVKTGELQELKICRQSPGISHLLFAGDSLLFFKANSDQANKVKNILDNYERASGQLISPSKCSLLLGNKCSQEGGHEVINILKVEIVSFEEKYLGLPVPEGRMVKGKFKQQKIKRGKE